MSEDGDPLPEDYSDVDSMPPGLEDSCSDEDPFNGDPLPTDVSDDEDSLPDDVSDDGSMAGLFRRFQKDPLPVDSSSESDAEVTSVVAPVPGRSVKAEDDLPGEECCAKHCMLSLQAECSAQLEDSWRTCSV